jgi:hypothetical protein
MCHGRENLASVAFDGDGYIAGANAWTPGTTAEK